MNAPDIFMATLAMVEAFEDLGIRYCIGGSVASSIHGLPRSTIDVDLIADLRGENIRGLVRLLQDEFYVEENMIREAIERRSSFNVIHLATMLKLDVFILKSADYDIGAFDRARDEILDLPHGTRTFKVASAEDVVLHKLSWYRLGEHVSERQWNDVLGVLKVQGTALDMKYLKHWASILELSSLLRRALDEAGISSVDIE